MPSTKSARKNPGGWFPEQKLSVAVAFDNYNKGSAYAEFQESEKDSITIGKFADGPAQR
jgi:predicted amidohydrolase YtcJ